jgi:hypothetical protein
VLHFVLNLNEFGYIDVTWTQILDQLYHNFHVGVTSMRLLGASILLF